MTPDGVLRCFASFLASCWEEMSCLLKKTGQYDEFLADWMQANWEILVEAVLLPGSSGFLEVYGGGADCNGASSRVFLPEAKPTHRIVCLPLHGELLQDLNTDLLVHPYEMTFWGFVHWDGTTYDPTPQFNAVLLEGKNNVVVDLEDIEFCLEEGGGVT